MSLPTNSDLVLSWSRRLNEDALAARVVAGLRTRREEIWRGAFELLKSECPEYRNAVDAEFTRESQEHCGDLLCMIVALGTGRVAELGADPLAFVRGHAEWRARHDVPLVASLHAYRLAHKTYWTISRGTVLQQARQEEAVASLTLLSDLWMELFDHVGAVLTETHEQVEKRIVAESTGTHRALLADLLQGRVPEDAEAKRLAALCGVRGDRPLALLCARPVEGGAASDSDMRVQLRSLARLIEQALPSPAFGKLLEASDGEIVAILCSESDTAVRALARLRAGCLDGDRAAWRIGLSRDAAGFASLPQAREEAGLALDFADAARTVMTFGEIDLGEFLIRRADLAAYRLLPPWLSHFQAANSNGAGELERTIRAFADCSFNVKQTARRLGVHMNTVYFRLNRINDLTGVDPRTYAGTSLLLTALRLSALASATAAGDSGRS